MKLNKKVLVALAAVVALTSVATPQIKEIIKLVGVAAAVKQFGPDINKAINKLSNHKDTYSMTTKVVPILTVGIGRANAIGAAQVMGPRAQVDKVQAVAQPEGEFFGHEVRIRALIPVESKDVLKDIRRVDGVGVSGIVDLRL